MKNVHAAKAARILSPWRQHSFRVHIGVLIMAMLLVASAALVWSNFLQGRAMVLSAAEDEFARIEREIQGEVRQLVAPVEAIIDWMSAAPVTDARDYEVRMQTLPSLADALRRHSMLESLYVGYYNGDFFELTALRDDGDRSRYGAPAHAAFRLQSIERGRGRTRFLLLDSALNEIAEQPVAADYKFEPRDRPWYDEALRHADLVQTAPYVFFASREIGQTIARRALHGRAVAGADISLSRLSATLALARPSPSSQLALVGEDRRVIAHAGRALPETLDDKGGPVLPALGDVSAVLALAAADLQQPAVKDAFEVDGREWLARVVPAGTSAGSRTYLALATPADELLLDARAALQRNLWLALALVLVTMPVIWWVARRIAGNLGELTGQAAAIRRFNFDTPEPIRSRIIEINELDLAMGRMRETIRKFVDITTALAGERRFDRLLRRVLGEARAIAAGQGAVIYLVAEDGSSLSPADEDWDAGMPQDKVPPAPLSMDGQDNPVVLAARAGAVTSVRVLPAGRPPGFAFLDSRFGDSPVVLVGVPLPDRAGNPVGVLCIFLGNGVEPPTPERLALVEAFAGAGAVAIDNQRLMAAQKKLLDALIGLIAGAIDAKSPYTGGHCQRVPELTNMLTRAACEAREGPFAGFDLDEDGWEALKIAGGLHDCGKMTTPEYVVDKATKLETLYDRIHEVRMRFEVLKRDARIACLEAIAAGGDTRVLREKLETDLRVLDGEFAFVAGCNEGGEFMAPEKVARLKAIAQRTWQRTLDDRLGISWEEAQRRQRSPAPPLPATEYLLADKPEHVIERQPADVLDEDNPWGFRLTMPAALYNRGELYNLSVARGTLTEEERYKINDHIAQTIIMLESLPFPRHLKSVPELAGGHHEKMDGTGYPRRLRREEMSVPARIMAIADIFEALTAADRPYKKPKKLSEAVKIMSFMKKEGHVDPDLFDLFLSSGVYLDYARRYMRPEHVDAVDVASYVAGAA